MEANQDRIKEGNRIIAEFLELTVIPAGTKVIGKIKHPEISEAFLKYHTDWNWIMPVVEKIEGLFESGAFSVEIINSWCEISISTQFHMAYEDEINYEHISHSADTKIESVWLAVVDFLKWYNQQKR